MMLKKISYGVLLVVGSLVWTTGSCWADDKKEEKGNLSGIWAKKEGELKLDFSTKEVMKIYPHGDKETISIACSYTIDKEGVVKAKITEIEGKEEFKEKVKKIVPIGLEFTFKYEVKKDHAKLDDLKGENVDTLKSRLEGEYESK
jgi:hypothetical protein